MSPQPASTAAIANALDRIALYDSAAARAALTAIGPDVEGFLQRVSQAPVSGIVAPADLVAVERLVFVSDLHRALSVLDRRIDRAEARLNADHVGAGARAQYLADLDAAEALRIQLSSSEPLAFDDR